MPQPQQRYRYVRPSNEIAPADAQKTFVVGLALFVGIGIFVAIFLADEATPRTGPDFSEANKKQLQVKRASPPSPPSPPSKPPQPTRPRH